MIKYVPSNEELVHDYLVSHLTVSQIQRKYGYSSHSTVSRRLTSAGVASARHPFMNLPLTERQHQIIWGSLLGDASLKGDRFPYVSIGHTSPQEFYSNWLYQELLPFSRPLNYYKPKDKENEVISLVTYSLPQFEIYRTQFYQPKKVVPSDLSSLTPLSLSVWFMDDGGIDHQWRRVSFATCSFNETDQLRLLDYLFTTYNLKGSICWIGGHKYQIIVLSAKSFLDFVDIVKPHLLPEFYYKINC